MKKLILAGVIGFSIGYLVHHAVDRLGARRVEWYESMRVTVLGCNIGEHGDWWAEVEQRSDAMISRRSLHITDPAVAAGLMLAVVERKQVNVKLQTKGDWETAVGFSRWDYGWAIIGDSISADAPTNLLEGVRTVIDAAVKPGVTNSLDVLTSPTNALLPVTNFWLLSESTNWSSADYSTLECSCPIPHNRTNIQASTKNFLTWSIRFTTLNTNTGKFEYVGDPIVIAPGMIETTPTSR